MAKDKKKKVEEIVGKFKKGDFVRFRYNNELTFGFVWACHKNIDDELVYTIQVGGQCPWFAEDIKEESIALYK